MSTAQWIGAGLALWCAIGVPAGTVVGQWLKARRLADESRGEAR